MQCTADNVVDLLSPVAHGVIFYNPCRFSLRCQNVKWSIPRCRRISLSLSHIQKWSA